MEKSVNTNPNEQPATVSDNMTSGSDERAFTTITAFAKKVTDSEADIDPDIQAVVSDHFFEML